MSQRSEWEPERNNSGPEFKDTHLLGEFYYVMVSRPKETQIWNLSL